MTAYVLAGHAVPLYVTCCDVTVAHPLIVLFGAVYLHVVFASLLPLPAYVPPVGFTPLNVLHAVQLVAVLPSVS